MLGRYSKPPPEAMGFSLLELLTAILIAGILATIALPAFANLVRSNRIISQSNALLSLLMLGRSEAVKNISMVTLCKSKSGKACSTATSVNWNDGIILFVDSNANHLLDSDETILRSESPFSAADRITFSGGNTLSYRANGSSSSGTFTIHSGEFQKQVIVSLAGRARIKSS